MAITVTRSSFQRNTAETGGAIARFDAQVYLADSALTYNEAAIAGGGLYGKSDKHGAYVTHNRVRPEEFAATIYHALDIPLNEPQNNSGTSRPLTTGKPILELFG